MTDYSSSYEGRIFFQFLSPKGWEKLIFYSLILSFFIIYQLFLFGHLNLIFAATPVFTLNVSTPSSPATFSSTENKSFQVTITDTSGTSPQPIDSNGVIFQIGRNITFTYQNLTKCSTPAGIGCTWNTSPSIFIINFTPQAFDEAGISNFTWFANDSGDHRNSTRLVQYVLNQGNPSSNILIQSNVTSPITYNVSSNVGCSDTNLFEDDLTYTIYRGNSTFSDSTPPLNDSVQLGAGTYAYNCSTAGGTNWTAGSPSNLTLVVNKAVPNITLSNNTASVNTSQLVGYWKLDEGSGTTAFDSSGNGNSGALTNQTNGTVTWANGIFGTGLNFSATANVTACNGLGTCSGPSATINNLYDFNKSNALTTTFWFNLASYPADSDHRMAVFDRKNFQWFCYISEGSSGLFCGITNSSGNTPSVSSGVSNVNVVNNWYFGAFVYNGSAEQLYVNGILVSTLSGTQVSNIQSRTTAAYIGSYNGGSSNLFNGTIDEVTLWNRALTASEVDEIYQSSTKYPTQTNFSLSESNTGDSDVNYEFFRNGTISLDWHFDEGTGTTAFDSSGNGNAGTLDSSNVSWTSQGMFGNALNFSGGFNEFVNVPLQTYFTQAPFTAAAWVNYNRLATDMGDYETIFETQQASFPYHSFLVALDVATNKVDFSVINSTENQTHISSNSALAAGTWYYVVAVMDPSYHYSLFINGVNQTQQGTSNGIWTVTNGNFRIGADWEQGYMTNGTIDEVKFYPRALSAAEILCNYGNNCTQSVYDNETGIIQAGLSYYVASGSGGQNYTSGALLLPLNISKGNPMLNLSLNVTSPITTVTGYQTFGGNCTMPGGFDITCTLYRGNSTFSNSSSPDSVASFVTDQGTLAYGVYAFNFSSIAGQNWTSASANNVTLTVFTLNPRNATSGIAISSTPSRLGRLIRVLTQPLKSNPIIQRIATMLRNLTTFLSYFANIFRNLVKPRTASQVTSFQVAAIRQLNLFRNLNLNILFSATYIRIQSLGKSVSQSFALRAMATRVETFARQLSQQITFSTAAQKLFGSLRIASQTFAFNTFAARTQNIFKNISQTFSFGLLTARTASLAKAITSSFTFFLTQFKSAIAIRQSSTLGITFNAIGTRTFTAFRSSFVAFNIFANNNFKNLVLRITTLQFYFAAVNSTSIAINSNTTNTSDTWVVQGGPDTNNYGFNASGYVLRTVADNGGGIRSYVRFNLTAANIDPFSIKDAVVQLYQSGADLNEGHTGVSVYEVLDTGSSDNWSDQAITWNNQPCGGTLIGTFNSSCNSTNEDSVTISGAEKYYNWTVTQFAQRTVSRNSNSFTLVFTNLPSETGLNIKEDFASSRNSSAYAPVLYLNYSTYTQLPVTRQFTRNIGIILPSTFNFDLFKQMQAFRNIFQSFTFNSISSRFFGITRPAFQAITFFSSNLRFRIVPRLPSLQISITAGISRIFLAFRNPSLQVLINTIIQSTRTVPVNLSLNISNFFATIILRGSARTAFQSFAFSFANAQSYLLARFPTAQITFTSFTAQLLSFLRTPTAQIQLLSSVMRAFSTSRQISASFAFDLANVRFYVTSRFQALAVFFNFNVPQAGVTFLRNSILNILFNFTLPFGKAAQLFSRAPTLNTLFTAVSTRIQYIGKATNLNIFFTTIGTRAQIAARQITTQMLFVFNLPRATQIFSRNSFLNILFTFNLPSAAQSLSRSIAQSFSFNAITTQASAFARFLTTSISFNAIFSRANVVLGLLRIATTGTTLSAINSRIVLLSRLTPVSFSITNAASALLGTMRAVSQFFTTNAVVSSTSSLFRAISQSFLAATNVQRQLLLVRQLIQSFITYPIAATISTFFRTISTAFQTFFGVQSNVTTATTTTTTATTSATSQPAVPGPSAGGGGGIAPPAAVVNISFEPSEIIERLNNGGKDIVGLKITNNGNSPVQLNLRIPPELTSYITLDRSSLTISPRSEELVRVNVAIPPEEISHAIEGNIIANANGVPYNVPVTLIVTSRIQFLLDVRTEISDAYKAVAAGGKVEGNITIFNLGQAGRVDVDLVYGVRNSSMVLESREEFLAVKDKVSLIRDIQIPAGAAPGTYQFYAVASYSNATAKSYTEFNVLTPQQVQLRLLMILLLALLAGAILIIAAVAYRRKKKKQYSEDVYAKIQRIRGELSRGAERQLPNRFLPNIKLGISKLIAPKFNVSKFNVPKISAPKFSIPYSKSSNSVYRREILPNVIKAVKSNLQNSPSYQSNQFPEKEKQFLSKLKKKLVSE